MRHWYSDLGNYTSAAEAQRRVLEKSTTAWDRASSCEQLIDLYTKSSAFSSALEIVSMLDAIFSKTNEWNSIGLFRFSIFNTFSLTIAHPDDEAARAAFLLADAWARRCPNLSESDLNHGAKAAARCGFKDHYRRYTALAEDESWSLCALRQGRHALETASAWVVKKQTLAEK